MTTGAQRFKLVPDSEMLARPTVVYLVDGILVAGGFVLVHGDASVGKTFLGLDIGYCIASGTPWHGHRVQQGAVVYIAAEGISGLPRRVRAWKRGHAIAEPVNVHFLEQVVDPLKASDVTALIQALQALPTPPVLLVVDTWSACLSSGTGNENDAADTNKAAAAFRRIGSTFGATVMVVHHEGHAAPGRPRGSGALRGTADTAIGVSRNKKGEVTVRCTKQRDVPPFEPLAFKLNRIDLGDGESSCVLASTAITMALKPKAMQALNCLMAFGTAGATFTAWSAATGMSPSTFLRAVRELEDAKKITKDGDLYHSTFNLQTTSTSSNGGATHTQPPEPPHPHEGWRHGGGGGRHDRADHDAVSDLLAVWTAGAFGLDGRGQEGG